jgi:hypothetical protein
LTDTYQTFGLHGKRPSTEDNVKAKRCKPASSGRSFRVLQVAQQHSMERSVCSRARTWRSKPRQLQRPPALDRWHSYEWKWHMHMLRSWWLTIGISSTDRWKNVCNHEPLNYWRGPRPCYPLSIEASATRERNYKSVIKTYMESALEEVFCMRLVKVDR